MKILTYILEYLMIGGFLSWTWDNMRDEQGKEKCTFYTVLDVLLWPVPIVARMIGIVQGFIEGYIEAQNHKKKGS